MKKDWSPKWVKSTQPRKQRKYRYNAPLSVRHKFLAAHLSKELRERYGKRSMPVRKSDEVLVMKGSFRGYKGVVDRVDMKSSKIYVDGMKRKKVDGSEITVPIHPSNVMITKLSIEDKMRQAVLERSGRVAKSAAGGKVSRDAFKPEGKPQKTPAKKESKSPAKKEKKAKPDNGTKATKVAFKPVAEHVEKDEEDHAEKTVHHPKKPPEKEKDW